jgi:hypothetical protein
VGNNIAFQPMGKTVKVVLSNTSANNVTFTADSPSNQYRLANHDNGPIYVWLSPASAPANVTIPTGNGAGAGYAIVCPPGTISVVTGPQCGNSTAVQISAQCETGANREIYVTPGEGLG